MNRRDLIKGLAALPLTGLLPSLSEGEYIEASPDRNWQFGGPMMFHNLVLSSTDELKDIHKLCHPNSLERLKSGPIPIYLTEDKYKQGLKVLCDSWELWDINSKPERYSCKLNDNDNQYCINYTIEEKYGGYRQFHKYFTPSAFKTLRFYHTPYVGEFVHTPNGYAIIEWPSSTCLIYGS